MKIALFNDTGCAPHVGCLAVSNAHNRMLARAGCEVAYRFYLGQIAWVARETPEAMVQAIDASYLREVVADVDAVVVNGEGTIHHGAGRDLLAILDYAKRRGKLALLVNCVLQDLPDMHETLRGLDDIVCREPRTHAYLQSLGVSARMALDSLVMADFHYAGAPGPRAGTLVTDYHHLLAGTLAPTFDLVRRSPGAMAYPMDHLSRFQNWRDAVARFQAAERVVTGRHHGVYASLLAGTPFVAYASNTWKIEGTLEMFSEQFGVDFTGALRQPGEDPRETAGLPARREFERVGQALRNLHGLETFSLLASRGAAVAVPAREPDDAAASAPVARGIVLAVNYVPAAIAPEIIATWQALAQALAEQDAMLVILSTADMGDCGLNVIEVPYNIPAYPEFFHREGAGLADLGSDRLVQFIMNWYRCEAAVARQSLACAQAFIDQLLETLDPALVLAWQSASPLSHLLSLACDRDGRPISFVERGWLADTLMVDPVGNNLVGAMALDPVARRALEAYTLTEQTRVELESRFARAGKRSRYEAPDYLPAEAFRQKYGIAPQRQILAWFPHGEPNLLMRGPGSRLAAVHGLTHTRLQDRIDEILAYCAARDLVLVVQDHPFNETIGVRFDYGGAGSPAILVKEDVGTVLDAAQAALFTLSTIQYEAVLRDKPLGLLCESPLSLAQGAYSPEEQGSVAAMLDAMLAAQDWAARRERLLQWLGFVAQYYLMDIGDAAGRTRTAQELARMTATFPLPVEASIDTRIDRFLSIWRRAKA